MSSIDEEGQQQHFIDPGETEMKERPPQKKRIPKEKIPPFSLSSK
jgi:hypothetical protein